MSTLFWGLEPSDPQEIDHIQMDLEVPVHYGDLVAGLVNLKNQLLGGRIHADEFVGALQEKDEQLVRLFNHIAVDVVPVGVSSFYQQAVEDAVADVQRFIQNILVLLRAGLGEMSLFAQDADPLHLEQGLILAAKGEQEIIELLASLQDSQHHPMSLLARGGNFVPHLLAARFEGRLAADEMDRILQDFLHETQSYFQSALNSLLEMMALLRNADGPGSDSVLRAVRRLKMAELDARRGLANLQQTDLAPAARMNVASGNVPR